MLKTERTWRIAQKEGNGYCCYRIPGILPTADGALLLCCEERALGTGDWGDIDVAVFRMEEDGKCRKTLEIGQSRLSPDGSLRTYHNPVLVPDTNGRMHLIYHLNYARAFIISSADHGQTWGRAREITAAFQAFDYAWNVCASGPGHGVCMDNGRLIVSIWLANGEMHGMTRSHAPSTAGCIFSDDHGNTWHPGALAQDACILNGNETAVEQLPDGRLLLNHRNMNADCHRVLSISTDGTRIEKIWRCDGLPDPMCFGGQTAGKNGILFGNCMSQERRAHATVQYSGDAGEHWQAIWPVDSMGGYMDIAYARGHIYAFYEQYSYNSKMVEALVLKESEQTAL